MIELFIEYYCIIIDLINITIEYHYLTMFYWTDNINGAQALEDKEQFPSSFCLVCWLHYCIKSTCRNCAYNQEGTEWGRPTKKIGKLPPLSDDNQSNLVAILVVCHSIIRSNLLITPTTNGLIPLHSIEQVKKSFIDNISYFFFSCSYYYLLMLLFFFFTSL